MAGHRRNMEGDNEERRNRAREARKQGKTASEAGVTLGASQQRKKSRGNASHQERLDARQEGKRGSGTSGKPRPGNRDTDPKRTNRWG
jgi:hypothetical protein